MLVPSKDAAIVPPAKPADTLRSPAVERTASNNLTATDASPASRPPPTIHFEGGMPLPTAQPIDPSAIASETNREPRAETPAKPKKSKSAKRRPAKDDDVETTISDGFDSLQRSLASMF
jgi:hypothetical protein